MPRVAIIGAGFSGLTTAKYLIDFGHQVQIFELSADIGGVWSASRFYPVSLATQNTKDTYYLSDMSMPKSYPEWPSGDQVRSYLEAYAEKNNLLDVIALNTKVTNLYDESEGSSSEQFANWKIETSFNSGPAQLEDQVYDHVVICNGIFSEGAVPNYPGREAFEAAGGKLSHTSSAGALGNLKGKDVVVVGYGKSACDLANAVASSQAASTTLVARRIIWKLPRKLGGVLSYKFLLLTRFGEALFEYVRPSSFIERFFHSGGVGTKIRNSLIVSLEFVVRKQLGLKSLNLLPEGSFDEIARSTISLSTEGFYDKVQRKEIQVRKDSRIEELTTVEVSENGKSKVRPAVRLGDGNILNADAIIAGTGFHQKPPTFLDPKINEKLVDQDGNWLLYNHILPNVRGLTFNGYNSSLFCPTSSEAGALWIVSYLARGTSRLPSPSERMQVTLSDLEWLEKRSKGKHASNTNLVPFSLHSIDDTLSDVGVQLSLGQRLLQWLLPVNPSAYQSLGPKLRADLKREGLL